MDTRRRSSFTFHHERAIPGEVGSPAVDEPGVEGAVWILMRKETMSSHVNLVMRKQQRRYGLLLALWKATGGNEHKTIDFMQVAKAAGFPEDEADDIYTYLWQEGFFGNRIPLWLISLSHRAMVEIERSLTNGSEPTEHFSATVIQNFNAAVGAVLTGPGSTANVNQNFGPKFSEVAELIRQVREQFESFPPGAREEAIDVIDGLSKELQQPLPSNGRVKAFLSQIGVFTRDVTSGASAALLAEAIARSLGWH